MYANTHLHLELSDPSTAQPKETNEQDKDNEFEELKAKYNKEDFLKPWNHLKPIRFKYQHRNKHIVKPRDYLTMYNQITTINKIILIGYRHVEGKMDYSQVG